ncbi:MAG: disulfide bond formation protein B [Gallionella sp.]
MNFNPKNLKPKERETKDRMNMCKFWNSIPNRWLYLAGVLFAGGLMGFALYLQYVEHQDPCPLCMVQRVIFIALMAVFALAVVQGPKRIGERIYAALIVLLSLTGVGVASRHIWIQHLPKDQVPACGPGLDYMLETMPMSNVLKALMHGSGECAEKGWTFVTLGIPEWSLLCYIGLGVWAVLIALRTRI